MRGQRGVDAMIRPLKERGETVFKEMVIPASFGLKNVERFRRHDERSLLGAKSFSHLRLTQYAQVLAISALVASASAFAPGASVQPRLRSGATSVSMTMDKSNRAPVVTVFDHRGCQRGKRNTEYQGLPANSQDDEMLVKVTCC